MIFNYPKHLSTDSTAKLEIEIVPIFFKFIGNKITK
jgi:hypothetical protein